jgi:hypothetical protein
VQQRPAEPARDPAAEVPDSGPTAELERGDEIVQQLSIAKYALAAGDTEQAMGAIDAALTTSRGSLSELAGAAGPLHNPTYAGSLVRSTPAASATTPRPIPDQPTEPLAAD